MKSQKLFRNLIGIAFYLLISTWIVILCLFVFALFFDSSVIIDYINGTDSISVNSKSALITILIYLLISGSLWIYILNLFKNLMDNLIFKPLFDRFQSASFKLIGQLIIGLTIIDSIALFLFKLIYVNRLVIEFQIFDFWLNIAIGLFLIFLSKVFDQARRYREENELTV